ncbi:bile acid:sodium symporter family protein [Radiobacillus sp. PE A8.2]|uniref:bile acid:sodium symporter family protein n=1 Tax=Radiobacillus sp. PE A8.2 TaxID=3380349 RepID=UPI00388E6F0A
MLHQFNRQLERIMPLIAPSSVIVGVLFADSLSQFAFLVPWIFAFMTFAGSLSSNFNSLQKAIAHPLPIIIAFLSLHIIMPLWAFAIGHLTFSGDMLTITGLILAMVIPTGITSFIWVSICKGNIALTLSIILIDTILSPFIVPYTMSLFVGTTVEMNVSSIMVGLFLMVVIPSLIGMCLNQFTKGRIKDSWGTRLAPFSKLCLAVVIMINCAAVAPFLRVVNWKLILIACVMFFVAFCGYLLAWCIGVLFKRDKEEIITLTFTGGMRNISAGAVIAVAYFPAAVAVPVVLGMLFQQILASIYGQLLGRYYNKQVS